MGMITDRWWGNAKVFAQDCWRLAWMSTFAGSMFVLAMVLASWPIWTLLWMVCQ